MLIILLVCSSSPAEETTNPDLVVTYSLTTNVDKIDFLKEESNFNLSVITNVTTWVISTSGTSWITLDKTTGTSGTTTVKVTVVENTDVGSRTATVIVNANGVTPIKITLTQAGVLIPAGELYPNYNINPIAANAAGMNSTAVQLAANIKLGWNIGNSLEATGGETAWGNPKVTKALIDLIKLNGFNLIKNPATQGLNYKAIASENLKKSIF